MSYKKTQIILFLFSLCFVGVLNSCLITEFDSPPEKAPPIVNSLPDSLSPYCIQLETPEKDSSFHGIASALAYKNTNEIPLTYWRDSLTVLVYLKAPGAPCLRILKELKTFSEEFKVSHPNIHIKIITLAFSQSDTSILDQYIEESETPFPVFIDQSNEFYHYYGTGYVPLLMVFDTYGQAFRITTYENRMGILQSLLELLTNNNQ